MMFFWTWLTSRTVEDSRGLFRFFDGRCSRLTDPLQAARRLFTDAEFDWDETPALLQTGQAPVQLEAVACIARAVRSAFDIAPLEAGGLSELECLELLNRFRAYLGDVKKNGSLFPISSDSMDPAAGDGSNLKDGLGCGSTCPARCSAPPGSPAAAR